MFTIAWKGIAMMGTKVITKALEKSRAKKVRKVV
jgi:hypothetical protein